MDRGRSRSDVGPDGLRRGSHGTLRAPGCPRDSVSDFESALSDFEIHDDLDDLEGPLSDLGEALACFKRALAEDASSQLTAQRMLASRILAQANGHQSWVAPTDIRNPMTPTSDSWTPGSSPQPGKGAHLVHDRVDPAGITSGITKIRGQLTHYATLKTQALRAAA